MKVKSILISQPRPAIVEKSPFYELSRKYEVEVAYKPFIKVVGVSLKEFRAQRVEILDHTAVIFTSRTTVDSFFHICEEARITVPETMKYICQTEAVALYLQKYIVYRKRKISFADGSFTSLVELIIKHKEEKFLLALSEPHKPELPETLAKLKLPVDPVILARTVPGDLDDVVLADYDVLALYSPTDIRTLVEKFGTEHLPAIAVFGEGTLRAALDAGITVLANAPTSEAPSMAKALDIYIRKAAAGEEIAPVALVTDTRKEEFIRSQQHKLTKKSRVRRPGTGSEPRK
ncbi:uroporphyrinogen-III synthase [Alistipes sp.]|uniref:uroporphyrinogen-III synthase n=1 Tax=Alistipes sp. TaxID=1872444 RepID=UPI0025C4654C|nr:uroporphyrinogen-III synthase [Alistipes sp.]MCI7140459.1 uroporphyrinogen-III synthase [Alistipes sp.]MDY5397381.1 uroporphyrinogen-III synthase [Alistipes sp.]